MFKLNFLGKEIFSMGTKSSASMNLSEAYKWLFNEREYQSDTITEANSYRRHLWIHVCISKRAQNIARVPFKIFSGKREITSGPAYNLFNTVNENLDPSQLWEGTEIFKMYRGEAFWFIEKIGKTIAAIYFRSPGLMKEVVSDDKLIGWKYTRPKGGEESLDKDEIIQFKEFNPNDPFRGLSRIKALKFTLDGESQVRKFNKAVLKNGSPPGGVLESEGDMADPEITRIKKEWNTQHQGEDKAGNIAVLWGGMSYKSIKLSQDEAQIIEQKQLVKEEVHSIYDVPMGVTGDISSYNKANLKAVSRNFWTQTLIPELMSFERHLQTNMFDIYFPDQSPHFDLAQIPELQADMKLLSEVALSLSKIGFTANEINERLSLDFKNKPWRDQWWIPFSLKPADASTAGDIPDPPAEDDDDDSDKIKKFLSNINNIEDKKKKAMSIKDYTIWKSFVDTMRPIEKAYQSKLSLYFFDLRKEILSNFYREVEDEKTVKITNADLYLFNFSDQLRKLMDDSAPFFEDAIIKSGNDVLQASGVSTSFDLTSQAAVDFFTTQQKFLKEIVDTVDSNLKDILAQGVSEGLTNEEIANNIRQSMNVTANRSKLIARTEITSAGNGGRELALDENGFEKKRWVSSFDTSVRQPPKSDYNHLINEIIPIGAEFSTGLKRPGDKTGSQSTAGNVCNCRCTIIGEL